MRFVIDGPDSSIMVTKSPLNSDRNGTDPGHGFYDHSWLQAPWHYSSLLARSGTFADDTTMSGAYCLEMEYSLQNEPPTDPAGEYDYPQQT